MADKKKEVKEAQKSGESIVAKKFEEPKEEKKTTPSKTDNSDMYSLSYEDAKQKYGQGQGNNIYFMPKDQFEKGKEEYLKNTKTLLLILH